MSNILMVTASDATLIVVPLMISIVVLILVLYVLSWFFSTKDERTFPIYEADEIFSMRTLLFGALLLSSLPNVRGLSVRVDNDIVIPSGEIRLVSLILPINIINENYTLNIKHPVSICSNVEDGNTYYYECDDGVEKSDWFITNSVGYDNCIEGFKYNETLTISQGWSLCLTIDSRAKRDIGDTMIPMGNRMKGREQNNRRKRWSVNFEDDCLCYLEWIDCVTLLCRSQIDQINNMANDFNTLRSTMISLTTTTQNGFDYLFKSISNMTSALNTQIQGLQSTQRYSMLMTYVTILTERIRVINTEKARVHQFNEQQEFNLYVLKSMMEAGNSENKLSIMSDDIMKLLYNATRSKGDYDSYVRLFNRISETVTFVNRTHIQIAAITQIGSEFINSLTYYSPSYCVGKLNAQCQDESYAVYYNNRTLLRVDDEKSAKCLTGEFCKLRPVIKRVDVLEFKAADVILEDKTSLTSKITNNDYVKFELDKFIIVHSLIKLYCNDVQEGIFFLKKEASQQNCFRDSLKTDIEFIVPIYDIDEPIIVALVGSTIATFTVDNGIKKMDTNTINIALPTYDDSITRQIQEQLKTEGEATNKQFSLIKQQIETISVHSNSNVVYDNGVAIAALSMVVILFVYLIVRFIMITLMRRGFIKNPCLKKYGEMLFAANEIAIRKDKWLDLDEETRGKYEVMERIRNNGIRVPRFIDKLLGSAVYLIRLKEEQAYSANFR